jgi:CrcB protein
MINMVAVAVGAAVGANLRYLISLWAAQRLGVAFPYGTLIINVAGCLAIGVLLTIAFYRLTLSEPIRLLLVTGLLGGFTTFSSFGWETYALIVEGNWRAASLYIVGSVVLGLLSVFLGAWVGRVGME